MKKLVVILAAAALALTGCSSTPEPAADIEEPAAETTVPAETTEAPADDAPVSGVSDRGHQLTAIGQENVLNDGDLPVGTWTILSIDPVDTSSVEYFEYDQSLYYYSVRIRAEATTDLAAKMAFVFVGYDDQGVKVNDGIEIVGSGLPDELDDFPGWISMGEIIEGGVLIAMPTEHGSLVVKFSGGTVAGSSDFGVELEF